MNETLSTAEADKLFAQINRAMSADDTEKLTELTKAPEVEVQEVPEKVEEAEVQTEVPTEPESTQEEKEEDKESEAPSGETPAATVETAKPEEPAELVELKEQLAKLKKENHGLKSQAGRVPSVQRQVTELTKKLEELQKAASTPSNLPSAKLAPKLQEALKGIEKTDPELAKAIIESIAAASDEVASDNLARNQETLTLIRDLQVEEQKQAQMSLLLDDYPNAVDVFKSDGWKQWKAEQSENVQRLAGSGFAKDVSLAFELYARDLVAKNPELAPKETVVPTSQNTQASQVEQVRQQRKATSTHVQTKTAPAQVRMPDDPELIFQQMYEAERKKRLGQ